MKEQITKSCVMTYWIRRYNGYHLWTKSERTTVGFVQVRLEIVAIISSNIAALVRA